MTDNGVKRVIVVGGGLVGSLCAILMAKRGYHVTIYELREDIRLAKFVKGRSINLSLSNRGREALALVDLEKLVLNNAIPMKGRFLHSSKGETKSVLYDKNTNQCIWSVGRNYLNSILITAAEGCPNVAIKFLHKVTFCDFQQGSIAILNVKTQETEIAQADLIIGADGAFSSVRRNMQQVPLFEFSQTYIPHAYLELSIESEKGAGMEPNHLHIWPRGQFMMIALPNSDNSWTVTLFMPLSKFESFTDTKSVLSFFKDTFPDSVPLIGEDRLIRDFFKSKPSPLVSIKCKPYHVGDKFLIIGDAAHAVVPFYGQGMNAGFEDVTLLNHLLNTNHDDFKTCIQEFSEKRTENAYAISNLAMYNYVEMRDLVTRRSFHLRKMLDEFLFKIFPESWIPLYNSVTFTNIGYKDCYENRDWQDKIIKRVFWSLMVVSSVLTSFFGVTYLKEQQ